jgi:hypothetical protein
MCTRLDDNNDMIYSPGGSERTLLESLASPSSRSSLAFFFDRDDTGLFSETSPISKSSSIASALVDGAPDWESLDGADNNDNGAPGFLVASESVFVSVISIGTPWLCDTGSGRGL